jgi:hypothetical protein
MAPNKQRIAAMRDGPPSVRLPLLGNVNLPDRGGLLWYAGLGAMAAAEFIEWPVAVVVAGTHFVGNHARSRDAQELAEGLEAGV